jgi:hypothetical protein
MPNSGGWARLLVRIRQPGHTRDAVTDCSPRKQMRKFLYLNAAREAMQGQAIDRRGSTMTSKLKVLQPRLC